MNLSRFTGLRLLSFSVMLMTAASGQVQNMKFNRTTGVLVLPVESDFRSANGFLGLGLAEVGTDLGLDFSELTPVGTIAPADYIVVHVVGTGPRLITRTNLANLIGGGGEGGLADGDYGDITVSDTSTVITIDNGVVSLAKMANLATSRLIGRATGSTGVPEAIIVGGDFSLAGGTMSLVVTPQPLDSDLTTWAGIAPGTGVGTALGIAVNTTGGLLTVGGGALAIDVDALTAATEADITTDTADFWVVSDSGTEKKISTENLRDKLQSMTWSRQSTPRRSPRRSWPSTAVPLRRPMRSEKSAPTTTHGQPAVGPFSSSTGLPAHTF